MHETAAELVANNFTLFFDLNTDGVHADYLHTIVMFSEPRGNSDYYDSMLPGARPFSLSIYVPFPPTDAWNSSIYISRIRQLLLHPKGK